MITISAVLAAAAFATKVCPFCDLTFTDDFDYCTECGAKLPVLGPVTGTIRVMPKTAGIYVDGIYKSAGSARIQVKPGAVAKIRVSAPGYDTINKDWSYNDAARTSELIITLTKVEGKRKKTTVPPVTKTGLKTAGFWEGNGPIWISLGAAAACFGYGFYEDTLVKENYIKYVDAADGQAMSYYKSECERHSRIRNSAYTAGGIFSGVTVLFGTKKLFFAAAPGGFGFYFEFIGAF